MALQQELPGELADIELNLTFFAKATDLSKNSGLILRFAMEAASPRLVLNSFHFLSRGEKRSEYVPMVSEEPRNSAPPGLRA